MERLSEEMIREVLRRTDIVSVAAEYVRLSKDGAEWAGLCPFHRENTPSFKVSPRKQIFKCFGCGEGGNAITFLMKITRKPFPAAVRSLAFRLGLGPDGQPVELLGTVYVLELEGDFFYIGFTQNLEQRIASHFGGSGAAWTLEHAPLRLVETIENVPLEMENEVTERYMHRYGWKNVRGGDFVARQMAYAEIPENLRRKKKDGAYVLELESGKYYVGFAHDMEADIRKQFAGRGCWWTRRYPPVKVLQRLKTLNIEKQKELTLQTMKNFGYTQVRGYCWMTEVIAMPKELDG